MAASVGDEPLLRARSLIREDLKSLEAGDRIIVACSGGADSLALAYVLSLEAPKLALFIASVTIDHGLQPQLSTAAHETAKLLATFGFSPAKVISVVVGKAGGVEAAARDARYRALDQFADESNARAIYLAHTLDDQAESVIMGLARGSGPRSIAGMSPLHGRYRRPLLSMRRTELREIAQQVGAVIDDPMNADLHFLRVQLRNELLPEMARILGPGVYQALGRTADLVQSDLAALDLWAAKAFATVARTDGELPVEELEDLPKAIRTRILRLAMLAAGIDGGSITAEHLERADALLTDWGGQGGIALPGGLTLARKSGRLSLSRI